MTDRLSKFLTKSRKERTLKRAEQIQEEMHSYIEEMMSKNNKLSYQDCVNTYILLKISELHELQGMAISMMD